MSEMEWRSLCIAFAVDRNCLEGLVPSVRSFAQHKPTTQIKLYLWDCENLPARLQTHLDAITAHSQVTLYNSRSTLDAETQAFMGGNKYFQTLIPFLDQSEPDRPTLYLDHDVACLAPFELTLDDLASKTAGMVIDFSVHARPHGPAEENARLDRAANLPHFNGGILFSTPARMAARDICARAIALYQAEPARYPVHDQDALNAVLAEDCVTLDPRLNWQTNAQRYFPSAPALILHFTGKWKPWERIGWFHAAQVRRLYQGRTSPIDTLKRWLSPLPLLISPSHREKRACLRDALGR